MCVCLFAGAAQAQDRVGASGYPYSIMTPEPGERPARMPIQQVTPPTEAEILAVAKKQPKRRARGSSTLSTIPTYQSPLTPLGTAPTIGTAPSQAYRGSPAAPVPGVRGPSGTTVWTPPRPPGQGFQDRARSCVTAGSAAGVGSGQIGTYTRNCVNR